MQKKHKVAKTQITRKLEVSSVENHLEKRSFEKKRKTKKVSEKTPKNAKTPPAIAGEIAKTRKNGKIPDFGVYFQNSENTKNTENRSQKCIRRPTFAHTRQGHEKRVQK